MPGCIRVEAPITIVEGGTFDQIFQWKSGSPAEVVDLTGYSAKMQVRSSFKSTTVLIDVPNATVSWEADGDTGVYIFDDSESPETGNWKWRVYINETDTEGICASHADITGVYDLFLYNADGEAVLQQYGAAYLMAACTRSA
jgi:hypothetical protein